MPHPVAAAQRIGNRASGLAIEVGEICVAAIAHQSGRHGGPINQRLTNARALVIPKNKGFVSLDRTARGKAKLVLPEFTFSDSSRVVEEIGSV